MPRDLFAENNITLEQNGQGRDLFAENNIKVDTPEKNRFKDVKSYLPFLSDQELQGNLQKNYEKNYSDQGTGRLFAEGATLGFGKQAESLGKVIGAKALGSKEKFGDLYKMAIEDAKQELENIRKRTGAKGTIIEGVGELFPATSILKAGGKAFTGAKSYLGGIGQSAAGGAAISAIQGASDAENLSQIPEKVAEKGTEGGAIGAVLGAAFPVAAKVGSSIYQGARNVLGKKPAEEIIQETISPETAQKALTKLKETSVKQPTTALDVSEPEIENLVKATAQYPESKQIAYDFALGRSNEANKRIKQVLKENLSGSSKTASEVFDNMKAMQRELLPNMYEKGKNIELPRLYKQDNLGKVRAVDESGIFSKPLVPKERALASEYEKLISNPAFSAYAENTPKNLGELHEVRKIIDKDISSMKQAVINDPSKASVKSELRNLEKIRGQISNVLYKGSGSKEGIKGIYEKADNAFARTSEVAKTIQEGREFYKLSPHDINKRIQETPDKTLREFYRLGAREHLENVLNKSTKPVGTSKEAEKFIPNKYVRKQLRALVDNDTEYNNLIGNIKDEYKYINTIKKFGLTKEAIENNKPSAINFIAKLATNKAGLALDTLRAGERAILNTYKGINKKNAAEIMRTLSNKEKSIKAFENIVKNAEKEQKPLIREALSDMIPAILASRISSESQNANANELSPEALRLEIAQVRKKIPSAYSGKNEERDFIDSYQKRYNKKIQ